MMRQLESKVSKFICVNSSEKKNDSDNLLSSCHVPGAVLIALDLLFHLTLSTSGLNQESRTTVAISIRNVF